MSSIAARLPGPRRPPGWRRARCAGQQRVQDAEPVLAQRRAGLGQVDDRVDDVGHLGLGRAVGRHDDRLDAVLVEEPLGQLGNSVETRMPRAGRRRSATARSRHREHDPDRVARSPWSTAARRARRRRAGLGDPVAAGDADVEQALARRRTGSPAAAGTAPGRSADRRSRRGSRGPTRGHGQVSRVEQIEGGALERALRQDQGQHGDSLPFSLTRVVADDSSLPARACGPGEQPTAAGRRRSGSVGPAQRRGQLGRPPPPGRGGSARRPGRVPQVRPGASGRASSAASAAAGPSRWPTATARFSATAGLGPSVRTRSYRLMIRFQSVSAQVRAVVVAGGQMGLQLVRTGGAARAPDRLGQQRHTLPDRRGVPAGRSWSASSTGSPAASTRAGRRAPVSSSNASSARTSGSPGISSASSRASRTASCSRSPGHHVALARRVALGRDQVHHGEHGRQPSRAARRRTAPGTGCGRPIFCRARTSRLAMVASGTRNARAIAATSSPASVRSASATCASRPSAGWQQVKPAGAGRHRTALSGSIGTTSSASRSRLASTSLAGRAASRRSTSYALRRAVHGQPGPGVVRTPVRGQVASAASTASWTASSASGRLPRVRTRVARDIDHALGLLLLRQQEKPLVVYAADETRAALAWLDRALARFCGIEWRKISSDFRRLNGSIAFRAIELPHSVAFQFLDEASGRLTLVAPAVGELTRELSQASADSEVILFDGTFWSDDELAAVRPRARSARKMNHLPICDGSLDFLRQSPARRKIYTHINNTNPILMPGSPERAELEQASIEVARDGLEIVL